MAPAIQKSCANEKRAQQGALNQQHLVQQMQPSLLSSPLPAAMARNELRRFTDERRRCVNHRNAVTRQRRIELGPRAAAHKAAGTVIALAVAGRVTDRIGPLVIMSFVVACMRVGEDAPGASLIPAHAMNMMPAAAGCRVSERGGSSDDGKNANHVRAEPIRVPRRSWT